MVTGASEEPIRVTVRPAGSSFGYSSIATAPGHSHLAVDIDDGVAWARDLAQRHPGGGYIMIVDEVGLAVSNAYVAHDPAALTPPSASSHPQPGLIGAPRDPPPSLASLRSVGSFRAPCADSSG